LSSAVFRRFPLSSLILWPWHAAQWLLVARPIRFTRFGILYILFTLAVGAAAINTGNNVLYLVLGLLLGFIIVSGFLSDSCLWGLEFEWRLPASNYAGTPSPAECRIRKGRFPAVLLRLTARWDGAEATSELIYWLGSRSEGLFRFHLTPQRRGWLRLRSLELSTLFPFGLFQKFHSYACDEAWLIYPRLQAIRSAAFAAMGDRPQLATRQRSGSGEIPYLLRDYRFGDSARLIHWKTSARMQRFIVKEMEEETAPSRWLVVPQWPHNVSAAQQEDLLSFIASIIRHLIGQGQPVGLATPDNQIGPDVSSAHIERLFRYLALVQWPSAERPPRPLNGGLDLVELWKRYHEPVGL